MSRTATQTLYRSGLLTAATDWSHHPAYAAADALRPDDRIGRIGSLCASPTLAEMATWHKANLSCGAPYVAEARELRISGDPFIYPVRAWNNASCSSAGKNQLGAYWAAGMPLSQYLADPQALFAGVPGDDREQRAEVLLDPAQIVSARPVSDRRLILAADTWTAEDLERALRRNAWRQGRTLRDYRAERDAIYGAVA